MSSGLGRVEDRSGETTGEIDLSRLPGPRADPDDEAPAAAGSAPAADHGPTPTLRARRGRSATSRGHDEPPPDARDAEPATRGPTTSRSPTTRGPTNRSPTARCTATSCTGWSPPGTAVLTTSDLHGRRDISVLSGPRCFLRVLDATRLAFPDEGGSRPPRSARTSPRPPAWACSSSTTTAVAGLHLDGTARVVPADELRAEHPDLPESPVPGRSTDVWVVVEVGDLYPLDGDDVPASGPAGPRPPRRPSGAARAARWWRSASSACWCCCSGRCRSCSRCRAGGRRRRAAAAPAPAAARRPGRSAGAARAGAPGPRPRHRGRRRRRAPRDRRRRRARRGHRARVRRAGRARLRPRDPRRPDGHPRARPDAPGAARPHPRVRGAGQPALLHRRGDPRRATRRRRAPRSTGRCSTASRAWRRTTGWACGARPACPEPALPDEGRGSVRDLRGDLRRAARPAPGPRRAPRRRGPRTSSTPTTRRRGCPSSSATGRRRSRGA